MGKIFVAFLLASLSLSAGADTPPFSSIQCHDANTKAVAPVYLNIATAASDGYKGAHFSMGNIVQGKASEGVSGEISVDSVDANALSLSGFIGTSLKLNRTNGQGLVSGWVVYDPATGNAGQGEQLEDYPVTCIVR